VCPIYQDGVLIDLVRLSFGYQERPILRQYSPENHTPHADLVYSVCRYRLLSGDPSTAAAG
jgi:hypothetical protein